jgi:hypothetical protein
MMTIVPKTTCSACLDDFWQDELTRAFSLDDKFIYNITAHCINALSNIYIQISKEVILLLVTLYQQSILKKDNLNVYTFNMYPANDHAFFKYCKPTYNPGYFILQFLHDKMVGSK